MLEIPDNCGTFPETGLVAGSEFRCSVEMRRIWRAGGGSPDRTDAQVKRGGNRIRYLKSATNDISLEVVRRAKLGMRVIRPLG